jgi:hypothetical protein
MKIGSLLLAVFLAGCTQAPPQRPTMALKGEPICEGSVKLEPGWYAGFVWTGKCFQLVKPSPELLQYCPKDCKCWYEDGWIKGRCEGWKLDEVE